MAPVIEIPINEMASEGLLVIISTRVPVLAMYTLYSMYDSIRVQYYRKS